MTRHRPWIGTSWKMNKQRADAVHFARTLAGHPHAQGSAVQPFVIPPFPYIAEVASLLAETQVRVGAQNMHWEDQGAWTGEISPLMLTDCGATLVEIGHSERRTHFGETDETVALKVRAALKQGLTALVCIGDTEAEYDAGDTADALERQVRALLKYVSGDAAANVIIAYEPVWSIGESGIPATPEFANEQHRKIASLVTSLTGMNVPILYGGSVNPGNCVALANQSHIDGLFIGRSAWNVEGYLSILTQVTESLT
jgi:L-erythrulose 1-phosphate isomerase